MAHLDKVVTAARMLALILLPSSAYPQTTRDAPPPVKNLAPASPQPGDGAARVVIHRLEGVNWDAVHCELRWVISTGIVAGDEYRPSQKQIYKIDMDAAMMQVGAERRGFDTKEAENVHVLMDLISRYAADSTVWWESGRGEKIDSAGRSVAGHQTAYPDRAHRTQPVRERAVSGANKDAFSK